MPAISTWSVDPTRLLTRRELATVLADLAPRARRSANAQRDHGRPPARMQPALLGFSTAGNVEG